MTQQVTADSIYTGGPIITMVEDGDRAEVLAEKDGRILKVGSVEKGSAHRGPAPQLVELADF